MGIRPAAQFGAILLGLWMGLMPALGAVVAAMPPDCGMHVGMSEGGDLPSDPDAARELCALICLSAPSLILPSQLGLAAAQEGTGHLQAVDHPPTGTSFRPEPGPPRPGAFW
jgi:hypothetical protein